MKETIRENPKFSVLIPTVNEEALIGEAIDGIRRIDPDVEIIVSDGGSSDATARYAKAAGVRVVSGSQNRGMQCNRAAQCARGDILVFLYVDTRLPQHAFRQLQEVFSDAAVEIGVFRLSFDTSHWMLAVYTFCNRMDSIFTRFGDQCIVMRKDFFVRIGGFPDWPLFDDTGILQKARRLTRIRRFPSAVVTSSRKFRENGMVRQYFQDAWLMVQYLFGVSPFVLAGKYYARRHLAVGSDT